MKYVVDIDGTICTQAENYAEAMPLFNRIKRINQLYDEGHTIVYFTARGTETGIDWREITERQFKMWGVKYHDLIFGKPAADYYLDDRMLNLDTIDRKEVV